MPHERARGAPKRIRKCLPIQPTFYSTPFGVRSKRGYVEIDYEIRRRVGWGEAGNAFESEVELTYLSLEMRLFPVDNKLAGCT